VVLAINSILNEEHLAKHALDAYAAHLGPVESTHRNRRLEFARRFVQLYPDLEVWKRAPLIEQLGSNKIRRGAAFWCAGGRPYLYFLVQRGYLHLDWPWIIGAQCHVLPLRTLPKAVQTFSARLCEQMRVLGYPHAGPSRVERAVRYFYLRHGDAVIDIGESELDAFAQALEAFRRRDDAVTICGSPEHLGRTMRSLTTMLFTLRSALYHQGQINQPPRRKTLQPERLWVKPSMQRFINRYAEARLALHASPATVSKLRNAGCHLADWLAVNHPEVDVFAELTRKQVLAYSASLVAGGVNIETQITRLSSLSVMFHDATAWGWPEAPSRPLIGNRDLPKRPSRVPRFIPTEELERLMTAIRSLECPFQKTALIIARWSGARRGEISRLELDCLDHYLDGTPRLRLPAGKTATERMVPLHSEAADAIRVLQALTRPARGFRDERSGRETPWLFVRRGHRLSATYLFESALQIACERAGLLDRAGRATITAHRFRHTVGTELVEGGARLHTVMKMLGHTSTGMTLAYAHLSDATLREEYMKVLGPGAQIAGPLAETLRAGAMPPDSIAWLKANFFRTELELGHCLRLPEEGPCECDLYLNCAKFVTTPEYVPRLRARREREITMARDARERGFSQEAERHECTRRRIEQLLVELNEVVDPIS
jgi:integrase